jgi:hypothetical protein
MGNLTSIIELLTLVLARQERGMRGNTWACESMRGVLL